VQRCAHIQPTFRAKTSRGQSSHQNYSRRIGESNAAIALDNVEKSGEEKFEVVIFMREGFLFSARATKKRN
jgi:hypothetical protein